MVMELVELRMELTETLKDDEKAVDICARHGAEKAAVPPPRNQGDH
jgi:hypothetical protein